MRALRSSLWEARHALLRLAAQSPGPAHKLQQMLDEGSPFLSGLGAGTHRLTRRLEAIHGLLMVAAQVQSLHRDYQMHGTVDAEEGAILMGAFERLLDSLSEYTAVLLGLVPQVTVAQDAPTANDAVTMQTVAQTPATRFQWVDMSLANTGERGVRSVKLGLPSNELPTGTTCEPDDPAFFGTLMPGQTVHATFRIRRQGAESSGVPGSRCVADVCYLAGGGPVHLRPRPW